MLDARPLAVRRSFVVTAAALLLSVPTGSGVAATPAGPAQEEPSEGGRESADRALVDVETSSAGPGELAGTLDNLQANVTAQLERLELAQAAVSQAHDRLADIESQLQNTELRIEELVVQSDAIVVEAFINPPVQDGVEVFASDSIEEATVKQAILDLHAADAAAALTELDEQEEVLERQQEEQEEARAAADEARADAEQALADLEAAVSAQTRFVLDVRRRLASGELEATDDPLVLQRQAELQQAIEEAEEAAQFAEAMRRLAEEQRRCELAGIWECPVQGGGLNFIDSWGAARSGGRSHQGTDMMADYGTPTVAPVSGEVEHRSTSLGGLSWYVYGDDGNTYYGTHLQGYENVGAGHVERGTVIGYVGASGNAPDNAPHLHFEFHPGGGSAVNAYPRLVEACPGAAR
ncbi:MAG TPA: M23 family metallopeptidase [Acidimicrobiales bacterium]